MTFSLLDMDTNEIIEVRKQFLRRYHYYSECGDDILKNRYGRWIEKCGHELNYRCNTTKYIPR
ncbi:MAG: hypothetical protein Unbinned1446contig1005_33 [Prokaryotic dsDNA virus sp.]|nr:MAG: hypothetical protein Unbinned1446contig1005_33 [Prokaryotic dsDNA virus sp.]